MNQNLFVCTQLNGFKQSKWLSINNWPLDETLTDTTTPGQSGPGSNVNEVFQIPQSSRTGASPSYGLVSYSEHSLRRKGHTPL